MKDDLTMLDLRIMIRALDESIRDRVEFARAYTHSDLGFEQWDKLRPTDRKLVLETMKGIERRQKLQVRLIKVLH